MGISVFPPTQSAAGSTWVNAISQIATIGATTAAGAALPGGMTATNHRVLMVTDTYTTASSGVLMSVSGAYAGLNLAFEANTIEDTTVFRPWPAWHMQHGLWVTSDILPSNASLAYWMPSNGANSMRMRVTAITSGTAKAGGVAMHAPASIGTGVVGKQDWSAVVQEGVPGNNVQTMQGMVVTASTYLGARGVTVATSWGIGPGKRLRIHSYSGTFTAGTSVNPGKCLVALRSNMAGATTIGSDLLASWVFAPIAGAINTDGQWSGIASALAEPIDIYSPNGSASVGIGALGSPSTTGKLTFNLFGYVLG